MTQTTTVGVHILAEFYGVDSGLLSDIKPVEDILELAVRESKVNKLNSKYHQFQPQGVTGFVLLGESHISIHTWPEKNFLALDIFTCGNAEKAHKAYDVLLKNFKPKDVHKTVKDRGK